MVMKEKIVFSGHTVITSDKVEIQASETGDLMIFFNDKPLFMLQWNKFADIYKKANKMRRKYKGE